ncbi:MAG TPA: SDR family NAD(P)-dependent oxidoreductase [Candidatus Sulfotelmatobacter sp.]|nr:SDR family NAD(P)-dependent oxidoreductase [Candidatus Sulfotelmatobacter sp.]
MANLKGKISIVTGAGHGIGKEIALSLARNGSEVVITDVSDTIFEVGKEAERLGSKALPIKCDVSELEQAKDVEEKVVEKYERIDILVNNAGIYPQKAFLEMTADEWNKVIRINLNGVFHCTKAVLPKMVKQRYGKIVNIASIAGAIVGFQNLTHYSASKAAVAGFTKSLALEVAPYGVNVNAIAPGAIDVGGMETNAEIYQQMIKTIPIGRWGLPIDIANLVIFLVNDDANYITGQCIVCDGGYTLP